MSVASLSPTAPAATSWYLPKEQTGSPWLIDPSKVPATLQELGSIGSNQPVDPAAAARDIRNLAVLLTDTYALAGEYAKAGVDLHALADEHAQRVAGQASVTAAEAFKPFLIDLRAAVADNHLSFDFADDGPVSESISDHPRLRRQEYVGPSDALEAANAVSGAVHQAAYAPRLLGEGGARDARIGSVVVQGADPQARNALAQLGYRPVSEITPTEKLASVDESVYSSRQVGDTTYIRLTSFNAFSPEFADDLNQFVEDAGKHRGSKRIVFDLRGNDGGNDGYMAEWIRRMRSTEFELSSDDSHDFASGLQQHAAVWNSAAVYGKVMAGSPDVDALQKAAEETKASWPLSSSTAKHPMDDGEPMRGAADTDWHGEVIALVDRRNASSGEGAAEMLRNWMGATILGERTAGYIVSNNIVPYKLPETGLVAWIPSGHTKPADTRVIEGGGIPVDVYVSDVGQPAEDIAKSYWGTDTR